MLACTGTAPNVLPQLPPPHASTPTPPLAPQYVLTLKLKKTIVPVRHESFVFPDVSKLPEDVRPVFDHNAMQWVGAMRVACTEVLLGRLGFGKKK